MRKYCKHAPFRVGDKVNLSKSMGVEKVSSNRKQPKKGRYTFGKLVADLLDTIYTPFLFNMIVKVLIVLGVLGLCLILWGIFFGFTF